MWKSSVPLLYVSLTCMIPTSVPSFTYVLFLHSDPILLTQDPKGSVFFGPERGEGYIRTNLF